MAQINWSDPQVFWLNVTNLSLGIVVIICCLLVVVATVRELTERRRRARAARNLDQEVRDLVNSYKLGTTMADGGEPIDPDERKKP